MNAGHILLVGCLVALTLLVRESMRKGQQPQQALAAPIAPAPVEPQTVDDAIWHKYGV